MNRLVQAQMLNRCLTLGVQLFIPMSIVGCAVRAPHLLVRPIHVICKPCRVPPLVCLCPLCGDIVTCQLVCVLLETS